MFRKARRVLASTPSSKPKSKDFQLGWFLLREIEEATGIDRETLFRDLTQQEGAEAAGYWLDNPGRSYGYIVILPSVIIKYLNEPTCVYAGYKTFWAAFTHTVWHEICHSEFVEEDLLRMKPDENPHMLIDIFVQEKILQPLELDLLEGEPGDLTQERKRWTNLRNPKVPPTLPPNMMKPAVPKPPE